MTEAVPNSNWSADSSHFVDNETLQNKNTQNVNSTHYALTHIILQLIYRQHLHVSGFCDLCT